MQDLPIPVIRSKLYAPPVAPDAVCRKRLLAMAPSRVQAKFALISAAAGYGKSTLVSQWLEAAEEPTAWLSLDESDNDLRQFLSYWIAAIRTAIPDACESLAEKLAFAELPATRELADTFCIDFEEIGEKLILALDDYHTIAAADIHEFLGAILQRPPHGLQLVIATRRDPPLALQSMRATGAITEVRVSQLAFTEAESDEFVHNVFRDAVSTGAISKLHDRTEGWPAAMRLAFLAVPQPEAAGEFIDRIPSDVHLVRSYLMQEVLAKCVPAHREMLQRTAFLNRFCAELCEAVLPEELRDSAEGHAYSGKEFMARIRDAGLFGIALDSRQQWFRYHHLFQSMLRDEAASNLDRDEVNKVHVRASKWFENHDFLEEAIRHLLLADQAQGAADLIIRHRNEIMNTEQWNRLASWLSLLPNGMVESRPELLLLLARLHRTRGGREEAQEALDRAEKQLDTITIDPELKNELNGSLESSRCYQLYAGSKGADAVVSARRALEMLPPNSEAERGFARIILGGAMQMVGNAQAAREMLYAEMPDEAKLSPTYATRLLVGVGLVSGMDADLAQLRPVARHIIELAEPANLGEVLTIARYFLSTVNYHRNDLAAVVDRFDDNPTSDIVLNAEFYAHNMIIAALAHQLTGRSERASAFGATLHDLALKSRNAFLVGLAQAFSADLALRQGRMAEALAWADAFDPEPLTPMYGFMSPPTVLAKILVLADTEETRQRAITYLERLVSYLESIHNKHFLAEALAIRSLLHDALGETAAARQDLERAIRLAQPGRYIRLFVDLGPRLGSLLSRLDLDEEALQYAGEILAEFRQDYVAVPEKPDATSTILPKLGVEPLSKREQQILALMSERLSNKEIASSLHISPVTVKRHAANIYQKLGVHGRRQAVAKATGLGMLAFIG